MFSKGKEPNLEPHELNNLDDFIDRLTQGQRYTAFDRFYFMACSSNPLNQCQSQFYRLPQPEFCPDNIFNSLMMACWAADTEKRPTFRRILEKLNDFIAEYGEVI